MSILRLSNRNKVEIFHFVITIGMIAWTGILFSLYSWSANGELDQLNKSIKLKAESLAQHTQSLRSWVGKRGGVYIELDEKTTPNPLLENIPHRDIETLTGRKLTLYNSPAVLREISSSFESKWGDRVRLVSHYPINPDNMPDDWEKRALHELEAGATTVQAFIPAGEKTHFRLMYPMLTKPKCTKCHAYKQEDQQKVAGGLSVKVDKTPYEALSKEVLHKIRIGYVGIWIVGFLGLALFDFKGARLLQRIEFTATHDDLMLLKNRREIERQLNLECERSNRHKHMFSVMMMDIDHFKQVNDTYGHQAGDQTLRAVADTIRQTIRKTDVAGRYGGEEILIIMPETPYEGALTLAEKLRTAIKDTPITLKDGEPIFVTVSIGVSNFSADKKTAESIIKTADEALYKAKKTGRDRISFSG